MTRELSVASDVIDPSSVGLVPHKTRLRADLFDLLFRNCRPERYKAGECLFLQKDIADRIYGVVSGVVEVSVYSPGGRKFVASIELPRNVVGEIGALDGGIRTESAHCLTDCTLLSMDRAQFLDRLEKDGQLMLAVIELLCARLRWVSSERNDQALLKIEARLAKRLLFLSGLLASKDGWIAISQADLAAFLGASRESVNKMLQDWRDISLISTRRGAIRITNAQGLRDIINIRDK